MKLDDPIQLTRIKLPHGHTDHVGGGNWWTQRTFSLDGATQPPLSDLPVYIPEPMTYPGSRPVLAEGPTPLAEGVATTGLIAYAQPFPVWLATPKGEEQALAINVTGKGIVLITCCGHMGLDNLLRRVESVFDVPVVGVVGGLHYGSADAAALQPEIELVQGLNPVIVTLTPHDSQLPVLEAFALAFPSAYQPIQVGTVLTIQ